MRIVPLASSPWRFRDCSGSAWLPATVPGCVHTDLRREKRIPDPFWGTNEAGVQWIEERDWEYATAFEVGPDLLGEEVIELAADGLDTVATVRLNGRVVARTENMFIGYRWDVKALLRPGRNTLAVRFDSAVRYIRTHRTSHRPREFSDPVGRCSVIRKQQCQFGWDWGPRFVTAGIWRDIRLEGWSANRLCGVAVTQVHGRGGRVGLAIAPEPARPDRGMRCQWRLSLCGSVVASGSGADISVPRPRLWWPSGQGDQPLYLLEVGVAGSDGRAIGGWARRIGLRTIALDRRKDAWGESFRFIVNGRKVFAKGANWIPASSFVAGLARADYARDLAAAAAANMNMVRVWGGGIYESEDFYDLCDEMGLLVWQDFMFACTLYPADPRFVASARAEAEHQIRRLRHRACLALWCGNNEVWGNNSRELLDPEKTGLRADYERLFHRALPPLVAAHGGPTAYWPSSPWRGDTAADHAAGEKRGDTHYWDVWHGRNPVKDYERWKFRFVSEFGMQSYSSPATQATFCPAGDGNVFGAVMENHQKNKEGNLIILDYVSRRYRFPRDQEALIYLSQLNQAHCMQTGAEHYRRLMPRCMGALYWQLNDCWPVASWSSIEFPGRWKALQHVARRFFAPAAVSAHVPGGEIHGIGNYRASNVRHVFIHTSYDGARPARGVVLWDLFHLDGRRLLGGRKPVSLRPMTSRLEKRLDLAAPLARFGRDRIYLRIALDVAGRRASEDTVMLTTPRFMELPKPRTRISIRMRSPQRASIAFTSPVFQHRFAFDFPRLAFTCTDNYFELYPGETRTVEVRFGRPVAAARLRRSILHRSLADTY
ncbi:MAG TPA: glycoside hydrolase family 2 protein [Opitutaceae bacterium]|nr:glycoside hydrolase family 2 protein [Opitutaceae bacterium]